MITGSGFSGLFFVAVLFFLFAGTIRAIWLMLNEEVLDTMTVIFITVSLITAFLQTFKTVLEMFQ